MSSSASPANGLGLPPVTDPYLDPVTGVLRNLLGATTRDQLALFEGDLTTSRTIQVQANSLVAHTRDLDEVRALHRHLFQDLFTWAGEIRTIDMRRGEGQFFAPCAFIETNAFHLFADLRAENHLNGLNREEFVQQLSRFYDLLNHIHPFREGNGRTQRLFWSRVAADAGWALDWRPIHGDQLDKVSRAAREDGDLASLQRALDLCVRPLRPH